MNLDDVTNAPIYNLIVIKISFINLKKKKKFHRPYVLLSRAPHSIAVKQVKMLFSLA